VAGEVSAAGLAGQLDRQPLARGDAAGRLADGQHPADLGQQPLAYPFHLEQVEDGVKAAVLPAIGHDGLGNDLADPWQLLQRLSVGAVDVDDSRHARPPLSRRSAAHSPRRPRPFRATGRSVEPGGGRVP
jgi:hypothetical protein